MQLRIGNKQDEAAVRTLVQEAMVEHGFVFDLEKSEADLKNIEQEYIGHDGTFLVVESDGAIIAFAAARKLNDEVLELPRLFVAKNWRSKGLMHSFLKQILAFANRMEYRYLDAIMDPRFHISKALFTEFGFQNLSQADLEVYRYTFKSR